MTTYQPLIKSSNLWTILSLLSCGFAKGERILGWLIMKNGYKVFCSRYFPQSLSKSLNTQLSYLPAVLGSSHETWRSMHNFSKIFLDSYDSNSSGSLMPAYFYRSGMKSNTFHGFYKSISLTFVYPCSTCFTVSLYEPVTL